MLDGNQSARPRRYIPKGVLSMEQLRSLSALLDYAKKITSEKGPKRIAVAKADDPGLFEAMEEARKAGIAKFVLTGEKGKIGAACAAAGAFISDYEVIETSPNEAEMAIKAVTEVSSGRADVYMKGQLHTANFLRGMLNKEVGLRNGKNTISHCFFHHIKGYDRIFFITDAAFNMYPDIAQKADIISNAVKLAHSFGVECPKVACLAAVEEVNPAMPATLDAAALTLMCARKQIKGCIVDGPLALDNAVSEESAKIKKIDSPVAGKADILLAPSIEVGNALFKGIVYFAENETAGIIVGAKAPIVLTSRADSPRTKLLSIAAAVVFADSLKK